MIRGHSRVYFPRIGFLFNQQLAIVDLHKEVNGDLDQCWTGSRYIQRKVKGHGLGGTDAERQVATIIVAFDLLTVYDDFSDAEFEPA